MDRDGTIGFAPVELDRTSVLRRSKYSISSKAVPRQAGWKFPKQTKGSRAPGSSGTISCREIIFHHRGRRVHGEDCSSQISLAPKSRRVSNQEKRNRGNGISEIEAKAARLVAIESGS